MFDFNAARQHMTDSQIRTNDVTDLRVLKAFRTVAREDFVPKNKRNLAYADAVIDLDEGRSLMRAGDFAQMVQAADVAADDVVLDVACGRGYSTAILASLAETVVAIENDDGRTERATQALADAGVENAAVLTADLAKGAPEHGPYNVIFINGSVEEISDNWTSQLADKGRLVVVVQDGPVGRAVMYRKNGDIIGDRVLFDAAAPALAGFKREAVFAL